MTDAEVKLAEAAALIQEAVSKWPPGLQGRPDTPGSLGPIMDKFDAFLASLEPDPVNIIQRYIARSDERFVRGDEPSFSDMKKALGRLLRRLADQDKKIAQLEAR